MNWPGKFNETGPKARKKKKKKTEAGIITGL